jgi:hypothetical protein
MIFDPNLALLTTVVATEEEAGARIRSDYQTHVQEALLIGTGPDD